MSDEPRRFVAVLQLRMTASSLQSAARAAESAAEETEWVGGLDGVDDFEARAAHVGEVTTEDSDDE